MSKLGLKTKGSFANLDNFLKRAIRNDHYKHFDDYGQRGVDALSAATPVNTGKTAASWRYRIVTEHKATRIEWYNTNEVEGTSVAVLIQYGHGTGTGGYVVGIDYVNPAVSPIFDLVSKDVWEQVIT